VRPTALRLGVGALLLAAVATLVAVGPPARAASTPAPVPTVRTQGYVTMADGVQLAYTVVRPAKPGHYPTLFEYSGYNPGRQPDPAYIDQLVRAHGHYAYLGVNLRGTGCSTGTFDFFQPQEAVDGAAVIAWVRRQPWSNGLVGMIGKSYPGITQLFVAEQEPPGLAAIAPGHFFGDAYRDVARPGGIANHGFAALWSFVGRPSYEFEAAPGEVLQGGDAGCLRGLTGEVTGLPTNPYVQLLQHPYDDPIYAQRSPDPHLDRIHVPVLATMSWQDEQLGSRNTHVLSELEALGNEDWWATLTNGDHGMARTAPELADLERFYDHFLRGVDNGWAQRPRVQVWWDAGRDGRRAPGWTTGLDHWADPLRSAEGQLAPLPLALRAGGSGTAGALSAAPARPGEAATSYLYTPVLGTEGDLDPYYAYPALPHADLWTMTPPSGTAASFTSTPLARDLTVLGSASADLWITSTAPDVDLQVTITEVRPDGQEEYVEQGWLRASQRALDPARSTELRPYQTQQAADVRLLQPGVPALARVEVFPFGHLFRKGSRIRLWVEAPEFLPSLWAFTPSPVPSQVQVLHDPAHPSRLVLSQVPNAANRVESLPRCGSLIRQPCRPDPTAATNPAGPPLSPAAVGDPGPAHATPAATATTPSTSTPPARATPDRDEASPTPASSAHTTADRSPLPRTGASVPVLAALALLGLAVALHRLRRRPSPP
jgi:putative CocE/NonD family hydrolase